MNEEFMDMTLNKNVVLADLVHVFHDAMMVCWSPEALMWGVWYGGPTVHIVGAFSMTIVDAFTDTSIEDSFDARRSFEEWVMAE